MQGAASTLQDEKTPLRLTASSDCIPRVAHGAINHPPSDPPTPHRTAPHPRTLTQVPLLLVGQPQQALQQRPQVGGAHVAVAVGVVHLEDARQEGVARQLGDHLEVGARQLLLAPPQALEPAAAGQAAVAESVRGGGRGRGTSTTLGSNPLRWSAACRPSRSSGRRLAAPAPAYLRSILSNSALLRPALRFSKLCRFPIVRCLCRALESREGRQLPTI